MYKSYKSQLQELCQKRKWHLPSYSATKEGFNQMARFTASVVVNGETFNSSEAFISSKQAQNEAAKLAFLAFSSTPPGSGSSSSTPTAQYDSKEEVGSAKHHESPIPPHSPVDIDDTNHLCKEQLQKYAHKNNLDLPIYTIKTEGPSHAIRFKASVAIDGKSFESPTFLNTKKEAEQAAAKIALMSLPIDMSQKCESGPYKGLLLDLTQRQGFHMPTYITTQSDSSQIPTFFSTVKVEGEEFHGKASRSKKLAEQDAAKIAYIALKECECLEMESNDVKVNNEVYKESFPQNPEENLMMCKGSSSSSSSESNKAETPKTSTYMLYNGFKQ